MSDLIVPVSQTRTDGMLGASEAAAALGLDPYTSPLTLWKRLRGEPVDEERSPALDEAAAWGHLIEPIVRGKYAIDRNVAVIVPASSIHHGAMHGGEKSWLRATPDGFVIEDNPRMEHAVELLGRTHEWDNGCEPLNWGDKVIIQARSEGKCGLLQVKNRHAFARDDWRDGVPAKEQIQCRVEMAVCDLPWNDCAVLIGGNRMLVHRVERDLELEDRILTDLRAFWQLVQAGKEPSPDASAAWRQHVSEKMRPTKVMLTPDDDMRELVDYWLAQRRKRKQCEEEEEAAKTDIMLRLSAAGATGIDLGERGKVSAYKVGGRTDYKAYAKSLGGTDEGAKAFKSEGKTWALRAPGDDD